jgi:acetylornithine deacetylase/succinyl-diaminopimelate desuccinylase-like protein
LRRLDEEYDRFVKELVQLTEIPAPPFGEEARASTYMAMLRDAGLTNVEMDQIGNVMGLRRGTGEAPLLAVAAHLDTVFPEGTEVEVRREGNRLRAPGIGDDTAGLATLLAVARVLNETDLETESDLLFIGNVGEEGAGDLRGVKHLFRDGKYKDQIGGFISVESGGQSTITTGALGSLRYRVTFKGPGGHSYGAFGLVSPAYAMGNAIRKVSAISVPETPKTTFNIGIVEGGTSVNSIPFETSMVVDMRSESRDELEKLVEIFLDLVHEAVEEENVTRSISEGQIELEMTLVGDRPSGQTSESANIVKFAVAAFEAFGIRPTFRISSTDSNVPISLGIPAITIGRGGLSGRSHSLDEWVDIEREPTVRGIQVVLTTILAIAGVIN